MTTGPPPRQDENFQVHDGNAEPQGFGHIGFLVDDLKQTQANMLEAGVAFKKKEEEGGMRNLAFAYDPDRYWVELIGRSPWEPRRGQSAVTLVDGSIMMTGGETATGLTSEVRRGGGSASVQLSDGKGVLVSLCKRAGSAR